MAALPVVALPLDYEGDTETIREFLEKCTAPVLAHADDSDPDLDDVDLAGAMNLDGDAAPKYRGQLVSPRC
jgi:hypothetical protein